MHDDTGQRPKRIGFVATRISGNDAVSLEIRKWSEVLERLGHTCFYIAGQSDQHPPPPPDEYSERVRKYAALMGVAVIFAAPWIAHRRGVDPEGRKQYTIWDAYQQADPVQPLRDLPDTHRALRLQSHSDGRILDRRRRGRGPPGQARHVAAARGWLRIGRETARRPSWGL